MKKVIDMKEVTAMKEEKFGEFLEQVGREDRNFMRDIREWCTATTGEFMITDLYRDLNLKTREDMKAAINCLLRLCNEENPIIEKTGKKRGSYRIIDASCEMVDFKNTTEKAIDLSFPFDIQKFVELYPGNLIVLAGAPNAGKTAFMLNVIKMNMNKFDIAYFNSEMGATELRKRLEKFEGMKLNDWNFKAYERSADFQDVILTGEGRLNLIDYLEIHDEFYKVGGLLAEIHRKLKGAVAIVALQKNKGVDTGRGGTGTLEKPRLALAMEPNKIKIVKAKNWATTRNPNGLEMEWNLVDGCHFKPLGMWKKLEGN
jgi:Ni2+-binding GTPase involved in maturation of urease and hydrogenase